jgi:hypothetical protein
MVAKQRKWTKEDDARLLVLKAEGRRSAFIAKELGRTEASIVSRVSILNRESASETPFFSRN